MPVTRIDVVFKALADPSRRELLDRLHARSGLTLTELCSGLDMTRQAVTQHLAVLQEANLVAVRRQGREKLHYFNPFPNKKFSEVCFLIFEPLGRLALHDFKTKLEWKRP